MGGQDFYDCFMEEAGHLLFGRTKMPTPSELAYEMAMQYGYWQDAMMERWCADAISEYRTALVAEFPEARNV